MSTDSERDQSIDRILRKGALHRSVASDVGGEACLDAETFAAWAEGALAEAEAGRVEAHLADCSRCQALMASFATSEPAAATGAAPIVIPFRPRSPMQWLVTVAAGTAAASLLAWTAWPKPDMSNMNVPASQTMAKADAPVPTPMAPPAGELASPARLDQRKQESKELAARSETAPAQAKLAEEPRVADTRSKALQPTFRMADPAANNAAGKPLPAPPAAPAPAYVPPPMPPAQRPLPGAIIPPPPTVAGAGAQATTQNAPPVQNQQQGQQGIIRTETPIVSQTTGSDLVQNLPRADRNALMFVTFIPGTVEFGPADSLGARDISSTVVGMGRGGAGGSASSGAAGGAGAGGRSAAAAEVAVPITNIRWRILPTGEVGKTTDAGVTWQSIALEPKVHITQGAAPSATVCWLVGKAGVVLLSTDGGTKFTPLTFPEAVDLRSITAIDARRATVTTTGGRTFATTDGGVSWR